MRVTPPNQLAGAEERCGSAWKSRVVSSHQPGMVQFIRRKSIRYMLSARRFYSTICRLVAKHKSRVGSYFMHEEKDRSKQNTLYWPQTMREVTYRRRTLAVQVFCDFQTGKGNLYVQVLAGPGGKSTNTQHATLTNRNIDGDDDYFIRPSLVRCQNGRLKRPPRKLGNYPHLAVGSKNRYIVGRMGNKILARLFEVAIAKYDSM